MSARPVKDLRHSERCKANVGSYGYGEAQCSRKHSRDGWCEQHHPDTKKRLDEKREAKWAARSAMYDRRNRLESAEREVVNAALSGDPRRLIDAVSALKKEMAS